MGININWPRWIHASITKHIVTIVEAGSVAIYVEGSPKIKKASNFTELRIDGPYFKALTKGYWKIRAEVNILIQHDLSDTNLYAMNDIQGLVCTALTDIPLYKYGDDDSEFGWLSSINRDRLNDHLIISNFGKIEPETDIEQSTIEVHYETLLEE